MDVSSFTALFGYVATQHREVSPPRLVLAVLTYLEGLGYREVCSGDSAAAYANGGAASGPARHRDMGGEQAPLGHREAASYWYALDMVRDSTTDRLIDQMVVHVRMTANAAFVHCSRTVWIQQIDGDLAGGSNSFQRVDVATSGSAERTNCTLSGEDMIELQLGTFDDGTKMQNVAELCERLQSFFCKGSAREAPSAPSSALKQTTTAEDVLPISSRDGERSVVAAVGGSEGEDLDRFRVGQSDLDPFDQRGAGSRLEPGGMMVGPHHPMFGRGRMEPPPGHEGHLPPGARWDPIAPPGMPGFFPGDFERGRGRGRGGGRGGEGIHPDIMQPGRGGFNDGFGGDIG